MYELNMVVSKELVANSDLYKKFLHYIEMIGVKSIQFEMMDGTTQTMKCEDCSVEDHEVEEVDILDTIQLPLAK